MEKAAEACEAVRRTVHGARVRPVAADLARLDDVRRLAAELDGLDRLDVVVHNAGCERWKREVTVDGHECTFQVNHLAPFLLTRLLEPLLARSAPARVIFVSSVVHGWGELHWEDLSAEQWFSPEPVYYQSKLAAAVTAQVFARRLSTKGITVTLVPPGLTRTEFAREFAGPAAWWARVMGRLLFRAPEAVAAELLAVATEPRFSSTHGALIDRLEVGQVSERARRRADQTRLWNESCARVGLGPGDEVAPVKAEPLPRPRLKTWLLSVMGGEFVGFTSTALIALVGLSVFGRPSSVSGRVVALVVMTIAGLIEGALLGVGQAWPLRRWLPGLSRARFVAVTMALAAGGWFFGMSMPLVMALRGVMPETAAAPGAGPSTGTVVLFAMGFGAVAGALFGLVQTRVLKEHVRGTRWWVLGSALGWSLGLPFSYLAGSLDVSAVALQALAAAAAGALMGLSVAFGTWLGLRRLEPLEAAWR